MQGGNYYKENECVSLRAFLSNPESFKQQRNYAPLKAIYNSSAAGRDMLERAAKDGVKLCDMDLSDGMAGVHRHHKRQIGIDYAKRPEFASQVATIVHELAHHYQSHFDADYYNANRSLEQNQQTMLAMETTAPTVEVIILFLAGQKGTLNWRTEIPENFYLFKWLTKFEEEYYNHIGHYGDHDDAVNYAASQVWQDVLLTQSKLDYYNDYAARFTALSLNNMGNGNPEDVQRDVENTVNNSGRIGDRIYFSRYENMPRGDALFGNNKDMKALHAALEWHRHAKLRGLEDPYVIHSRARLIAEGNSFLDVDFKRISCQLQQGEGTLVAFKNEAQRYKTSNQPMQKPDNVTVKFKMS